MTHYDDPRSQFGMRFSILARRWRRKLEADLAAAGLTDATWAPMVHLHESGGGITQKDLAARVGVDGSSLVRVLDILERDGLIERRRDASDGRAKLISFTPAGESRVALIRAELLKSEQKMMADLPDDLVAAMLTGFAKIEAQLALDEGGQDAQR